MIFLTFAVILATSSSPQPASEYLGVWRVERGIPAPWVRKGVDRADVNAWLGRSVRFTASRVVGPGVLSCGRAHYESISQPADGLFQGGLPAPAEASVKSLGVPRFPVPGFRLDCDAGSFDFHRVDATTMLVAVDHVIWTLSRAPGALASAASPGGVVQRFMEQHFAGDMEFTPQAVTPKRSSFTSSLAAAIARYFARPSSPDVVPPINGDPFTDTQDYPTRFTVSAGTRQPDGGSVVRVRLADAFSERTVRYHLRPSGATWRIDDVRYDDGESLMKQLHR